MNLKTESASERLAAYLQSKIEQKEKEQFKAEGELSALRSTLATLQQFTQQAEASR